jgi:hypothetical protein
MASMKKATANFCRYWYLYLPAIIVIAAGLCLAIPSRKETITLANYDKIEFGMTENDVESILGLPWDGTTPLTPYVSVYIGPWPPNPRAIWQGEKGTIELQFHDGIVSGKQWIEIGRKPTLFWDKIKGLPKKLGL